MPRLPLPTAAPDRPESVRKPATPRVVVLGDLMLDVVLAPGRPLEHGTDVAGTVALRQGGSAATTARWLGRLGIRTTFICSVGRDAVGRALTDRVGSDGVQVRATRVAGVRTGRIGVLVEPGGDRSFVADRGAADRLRPEDLRADWFEGADLLHIPAYSLLSQPLAKATSAAVRFARERGALVSLDLASSAPLLAAGRRPAMALVAEVGPDLLFATDAEARAYLGGRPPESLVEEAAIAVLKRGIKGATVLTREASGAVLRFEVATNPMRPVDTTGAGDAFDAGFLAAWLQARARGVARTAALHRAASSGHRTAARQLVARPQEVVLG